jgi:protein phosphatase 2C family protein 2/3
MPLPDSQASSAPAETDTELSTASKDIPVQPAGSTVSNDNQDEVGNALFGVFDGHGGSTVAKFSGSTMHTRLQGLESYSTYLFGFGDLN